MSNRICSKIRFFAIEKSGNILIVKGNLPNDWKYIVSEGIIYSNFGLMRRNFFGNILWAFLCCADGDSTRWMWSNSDIEARAELYPEKYQFVDRAKVVSMIFQTVKNNEMR